MGKIDLKINDKNDYRKLPVLSQEQLKRFRELDCQCDSEDPIVVVRYFFPFGSSTLFATEFNESTGVFYGIYTDNQSESYTMWDVEFIKKTELWMGLRIERDKWFKETNVSKISKRLHEYRKKIMKEVANGDRHKHDPFGYNLAWSVNHSRW
jgi:hypothetical protein